MVVQFTESEFVPSVKNPYEDMNYNDCDLFTPNLSILIDAISTQGKMEDGNHNNDEENVDINAIDNEPSPLLNNNNTLNHRVNHRVSNNNNDDGFVINHSYDLNNNIHINSKDPKNHQLPCSSLKDYEISKLPLRKRHLVPDSAYYNIHQCLSSPQSPPTPKQTLLNPFGGNSLLGECSEQRVPSPNSSGTNTTIADKPPMRLTEEDDVDVEGVEDEDQKIAQQHQTIVETTTTTSNGSTSSIEINNPVPSPNILVKAENTLVKVESDQELEVDIMIDDEDSRVKEIPTQNNNNNSNHVKKEKEKDRERDTHKEKPHHTHNHNNENLRKRLKKKEHRDGRKRLKVHHGAKSQPHRDNTNILDDSDSDSAMSESEEDRSRDNRLYCVCRKKYDSNSFMIACDKCDEWYHGECVNISEKDAKRIDRYVCMKCKKKVLSMTLPSNSSNNNTNNNTNNNSPRHSPNQSSQKTSPSLLTSNSPFIDINSHTPASPRITNSPPHQPASTPIPNRPKCAYSKCNNFPTGTSKYCSKDCGVANAKELLHKNPSLHRSILSNGGHHSIHTPGSPQKSLPPNSDTNPLTQKLMSTSNCDDISKLQAITLKRSEIESKLKKLEMKCSEFEKTIQMTKFKVESLSTPDMYSINNRNQSNSPPSNTPCTFPLKESPNGICGVLNCTNHNNWEKRKRDLFTREQSYYTKALRDIALEEKQIHQRIARRNKMANLSTIAIGGEPEY